MEELFTSKHGILYLGIILILHLLFRVAEFVWNILKNKSDLTEQSVKDLTASVEKLRTDLRRFYAAIKIIAKDDWPKIRDEIMEDTP